LRQQRTKTSEQKDVRLFAGFVLQPLPILFQRQPKLSIQFSCQATPKQILSGTNKRRQSGIPGSGRGGAARKLYLKPELRAAVEA
jgi:hypothetical protein